MSLFVIVLIIFLIAYGFKSLNDKGNHNQYIRETTTNAKEQYDYCCKQIESFAKEYRHEASKMDMETYFSNKCTDITDSIFYKNKNNWHIDYQFNQQYNCFKLDKCDKFINFEKIIDGKPDEISQNLVPNYNIEKIWLTFTAMACGINLKTNYMSYIYKNDVWDDIPLDINEIDLSMWQNKYNQAPQDLTTLLHFLNISVYYKRYILKEMMYWDSEFDETGNSYEVYNNPIILNTIAQKHNFPDTDELSKGWNSVYENISDIALLDSKKYIKNKGFCPVNLLNITPYPTQRDKDKNYTIKSLRELKENNQRCDIRKKYPYI